MGKLLLSIPLVFVGLLTSCGGGVSRTGGGGNQSVLSSIQVTPANDSIPAGLTQGFEAIGT